MFSFFHASHFADFPCAPISWDAQFSGIAFFCNVIFVVSHGLRWNLARLWVCAGIIPLIAWITTFKSIMDVLPCVKNGLHLFWNRVVPWSFAPPKSFFMFSTCPPPQSLRRWQAFYEAFKALPTLKKYFESDTYKTMDVSLRLCWKMLGIVNTILRMCDFLDGYQGLLGWVRCHFSFLHPTMDCCTWIDIEARESHKQMVTRWFVRIPGDLAGIYSWQSSPC